MRDIQQILEDKNLIPNLEKIYSLREKLIKTENIYSKCKTTSDYYLSCIEKASVNPLDISSENHLLESLTKIWQREVPQTNLRNTEVKDEVCFVQANPSSFFISDKLDKPTKSPILLISQSTRPNDSPVYSSSLQDQIPFIHLMLNYLSKWMPWNKLRFLNDVEINELKRINNDLPFVITNIKNLKTNIIGQTELFVDDLHWLLKQCTYLEHATRKIMKDKKGNYNILQEVREINQRMNNKLDILLKHQVTLLDWEKESLELTKKGKILSVSYDFINYKLTKKIENINIIQEPELQVADYSESEFSRTYPSRTIWEFFQNPVCPVATDHLPYLLPKELPKK